jgi:16S rRNA processing protein RimM
MGAGCSLTSSTDLVAGRIGRPHGLDGSVHVNQPVAALLDRGRRVVVAGSPRTIVRRAGTDERPIVKLDGARTREDAEALRDQELLVAREQAPPLEADEWYAADLVGCRVVDGATEVVQVDALVGFPSCEALDVGGRLIPLVRDAVRSVDVKERVIDVDLAFLGDA